MSIDDIYHYMRVDERVSTAGQPKADEFTALAQAGFDLVINLAPYSVEGAVQREDALVLAQDMKYVHIPVVWDDPREEDFHAFVRAMDANQGQRVFVHCAANYRASAFYGLYAQQRLGWSEEQAEQFRGSIWHGSDYPIWERFIRQVRSGFSPAE